LVIKSRENARQFTSFAKNETKVLIRQALHHVCKNTFRSCRKTAGGQHLKTLPLHRTAGEMD
jgi:hypothetical protein